MQEELREIEIALITPNPQQPRRHFEQADLEELAASIKAVGIIHPPTVQATAEGNGFELISGERRYRAAQLAGLNKIPVIIRPRDFSLSAQAALIENIQRVDLNPIEIAKALRNLSREFGLNQEELALRLGKKRSTIANYLRLLMLPQSIQDSVAEGTISMGHAKAILALESPEKQHSLHEKILQGNLTVRQTEAAVYQQDKREKEKSEVHSDCHLQHLMVQMQHKLGTKVVIQGEAQRGRIMIDYYSLDDLDRLLVLMGVVEMDGNGR